MTCLQDAARKNFLFRKYPPKQNMSGKTLFIGGKVFETGLASQQGGSQVTGRDRTCFKWVSNRHFCQAGFKEMYHPFTFSTFVFLFGSAMGKHASQSGVSILPSRLVREHAKSCKKRANAPCAVGKPKWISGRQRRISDLGLRCHCVRVWVWGARLAQTANPRRHGDRKSVV